MSAADADMLVTLRLVQGRSDTTRRRLGRANEKTLLKVGTDPGCDWRLQGEAIAPIHFAFSWDGSALLIARTPGAPPVRANGSPVGEQWTRLSGRARIDFGGAAIVVETLIEHQATEQFRSTLPGIPTKAFASAAANPAGGSAPTRGNMTASPLVSSATYGGEPDRRGVAANPSRVVPASLTPPMAVGSATGVQSRPTDMFPSSWGAATAITDPRAGLQPREQSSLVLDDSEINSASDSSVPQAVLVLSPNGDPEALDADEDIASRSSFPARAPALPSWGQVGLAMTGLLVGYLCWLYLLYNL